MIETIKGELEFPLVGIAIVNSREKSDATWYRASIESARNQFYTNYKVCIIDNKQRLKTIAQCRNQAVEELLDCKWILFLDDDDIIANDYLISLVSFAENCKDDKVVWVSSHCTFFYPDGVFQPMTMSPIGLWRTTYLYENKFKEILLRFEDVEASTRLESLGYKKMILQWIYGYYYRQHTNQISRVIKEEKITPENNSKLKNNCLKDLDKILKEDEKKTFSFQLKHKMLEVKNEHITSTR